ncbi:uncharacterized protein LOC105198421 [Solenopsis invicta]|uniref:uncharacterized protein LOC105198421 n=1 Tax=Solenopsis invicta TaxID=13686 RepID=UPI00193D5C17|nr:uncharacterized protein LOC105198421 [Solenopsis invicta]
MERFSVILFSLCALVILAGSTPTGLSTIETLWDNVRDVRDIEDHHVDLVKSKNVQNSTKQLLMDENPMKNITHIKDHEKEPSYLKVANASTTLISDFSSSHIKDSQHLKQNGDREGDAYRKEEPSAGLPSHDILLDPALIPVRLSRQTEKGDITDYSNLASIENISSDTELNNHDERGNVLPSRWSSNFEDDLGVAEDRYPPPYPYSNPYYQRQFPNRGGQFPYQGYRINDRREPYHNNYWRYPVFPGK